MTDTPERILATIKCWGGDGTGLYGGWIVAPDYSPEGAGYIRADLHQAALDRAVKAEAECERLRAALADVLMIAEYLKWQDADDGRSATYARARAALEGK